MGTCKCNTMAKKYTVITFGTYDLFHLGHLRIIERAREVADREGARRGIPGSLVVGVSSDQLTRDKKIQPPIVPESERLQVIGALRAVDACFLEERLDLKCAYIKQFEADCLVMGDDHTGRFSEVEACGCCRIFLERTMDISTTSRIEGIRVSARDNIDEESKQKHEEGVYK